MNQKIIKIYAKYDGLDRLHCILKGKVCCVLPILDKWEISYYLHCDAVEQLQKNGCEILRFKDGRSLVEVSFQKAILSGYLAQQGDAGIICIPKKWGKKKDPQLF